MKRKIFNLNMLSQIGSSLPKNLVSDYQRNEKFPIDFILSLKEDSDELQQIKDLCATTNSEVELWFSHKKSASDIAKSIPRSENFYQYKHLPFEVGKCIGEHLPYSDSAIVHYIDIVFIG